MKRLFYHGSNKKGIMVLRPKLDKRTGIKGVFLSDNKYGPMVFSLLRNRAKSSVDLKTKNNKFITGKLISDLPLNQESWLYILKPNLDHIKPYIRKSGEYYLLKPYKVHRIKRVTKRQVERLGWKIKIRSKFK